MASGMSVFGCVSGEGVRLECGGGRVGRTTLRGTSLKKDDYYGSVSQGSHFSSLKREICLKSVFQTPKERNPYSVK